MSRLQPAAPFSTSLEMTGAGKAGFCLLCSGNCCRNNDRRVSVSRDFLAPTARSHGELGATPQDPGNDRKAISAESAIHFRHQSDPPAWLKRTFSACLLVQSNPGARLQAEIDFAPSALSRWRRHSLGQASAAADAPTMSGACELLSANRPR
jgi:hypothetical protein